MHYHSLGLLYLGHVFQVRRGQWLIEALQTSANYGPKRHISNSSGQAGIWLNPIRFVIPGVRHCPLFVLAVRILSLYLLFVPHTVRQSWCISLLLKYSYVNNFIRLSPELRTSRFCSGRFTYLRIRVTSDKSSLNTFAGYLLYSAAFVSSALFPTITLSVPRDTCQPRGLRGCHAEITTVTNPFETGKRNVMSDYYRLFAYVFVYPQPAFSTPVRLSPSKCKQSSV